MCICETVWSVDTHLDVNVAAGLDHTGGLLGVEPFPTTMAGNKQLHKWMTGSGSWPGSEWKACLRRGQRAAII